ncbi:hypothetical protein cyc_02410 [Cyclospora cayetanensis]|uniref:ATPase n=1 Tax=Cyclospora cayetanensis TaxID=88456 RepID=A0A1D3D999_9EIME|nr:hypothetical protein cyc_02410 [Cyclospora cayetanensis]
MVGCGSLSIAFLYSSSRVACRCCADGSPHARLSPPAHLSCALPALAAFSSFCGGLVCRVVAAPTTRQNMGEGGVEEGIRTQGMADSGTRTGEIRLLLKLQRHLEPLVCVLGEYGGGKRVKPRGAPQSAEMHKRDLAGSLISLEGQSYGAYKSLIGCWAVGEFSLFLDKVQSDPFAPPSCFRLRLPQAYAQEDGMTARWPTKLLFGAALSSGETLVAAAATAPYSSVTNAPSSGLLLCMHQPDNIRIDKPGQYVLPRSSMVVTPEYVEARCTIGLPARGRRIEGRRAAQLLCHRLPELVRRVMKYSSLDPVALQRHVECVEDQEFLRSKLKEKGLTSFVANGACLPRRSGVDDAPMTREQDPNLVLFQSPPNLECEFTLPNTGKVRGMGIPRGITLIVGGGFHGKSTMLEALQVGVYNKVPGDGREFVVTEPQAVKVRTMIHEYQRLADISPFISNLPFGKSTSYFSSADASGSTSQAANIMEALEFGASALLIDEDTCATNFMIRDARMQALVAKEKEPITPFLFRVKRLFTELNVSTVMVIGGSGDFFEVADVVLQFDKYQAYNVTQKAKEIVKQFASKEAGQEEMPIDGLLRYEYDVALRLLRECKSTVVMCAAPSTDFPSRHAPAVLLLVVIHAWRFTLFLDWFTSCTESLHPKGKVKVGGTRAIAYGGTSIDVTGVEQLVDNSQTRGIACFIQKIAENYEQMKRGGKRAILLYHAHLRYGSMVPY